MGITQSLNIYQMYAYVGVVCAVVCAIILNRVKSTDYKESIDKVFCTALSFFIAFCAVDVFWGVIGTLAAGKGGFLRVIYLLSTYGFHVMAAWASFICSNYVASHLQMPDRAKRVFRTGRLVLIGVQMILIFQNLFTGLFFTIDGQSVYHSGVLRTVSFLLQFCHYIPIIIYILVRLPHAEKDKETVYINRSSLIFSVLPLLFGALQLLYPDGPFYSLGFLITAVTMYAFNITQQRESYMAAYYAAEEYEKSRAQIEAALEKAEAASAAKTTFLANMSHDIRTPINGIMGMITLAEKEEMSPTLSTYLKKINVASRHLLSLVNDVLDMSRIESGKAEIVCEKTDVRIIVDNCASIIQGQIEGRNLDFEKKCDGLSHPRVLADTLHIRQVLINILGNAVKFTPDGGTVRFETREVSFDGKVSTFEFRIQDTGIGMGADFMAHLFEAFSQERGGSRAKYQGTGLGMTISKHLVELMGGTIEVESEPNKGSLFLVRIPLTVDNSRIPEERIAENGGIKKGIRGVKILLVEDNALNMEIARALLEEEGGVITEAENGKIAVDLFRNNPPGTYDVILMDLMMPEMNGFEATRTIRALDRDDARRIPIIAMTANAFAEDKIRSLEAGMNAHTAKPIDFSVLIAEITRLLKETNG